MPFLLFRDVKRRTTWSVAVERPELTIGSSRGATITVSDPLLAAREIAVQSGDAGHRVRDLAGRGRLFVDGAPVAEAALATGSRVRCANTCFVFCATTRPAPDELRALEPRLDSEVFRPQLVIEALEAETPAAAARWGPWVAVALCGLAAGALLGTLYSLAG